MGLIGERLFATPLRLSAVWRPAVLKHLLALNRDDRYGRFASPLPDEGIAAYVERIDFAKDYGFATIEPDGQLSGFIHLATGHPVARKICAGLGYGMTEGVGYPRVRVGLSGKEFDVAD